MKRLFTFGCSHTSHQYPTWADILGLSYNQLYNFGESGTGHFHHMVQLNGVLDNFDLTEDDMVVVLLSEEQRMDLVINPTNNSGMIEEWVRGIKPIEEKGFQKGPDWFTKEFQTTLSVNHQLLSTLVTIYNMKERLSNRKCKFKIMTALRPTLDGDEPSFVNRLFNTTLDGGYPNNTLDHIGIKNWYPNEIHKRLHPYKPLQWFSSGAHYKFKTYTGTGAKTVWDGHWLITEHLEFVKNNFDFGDKYDSIVLDWHNRASTGKCVPKDEFIIPLLQHSRYTYNWTNNKIESEWPLDGGREKLI